MVRVLHLFADTNLFIQCRPLNELNWSLWAAEFDEVHLIVCRPVQREIDHQKVRGNNRINKRARKTNSLIKEILISEHDYKLIQEADPRVKLLLKPCYLPSPKLSKSLDYTKTDDEIVGCLHTYKEQNTKSDVRLLTHDSGPMASAKMFSLPFVAIPDDWLIPPESDKAERKIKQLQIELARLKKGEPRFLISYLDDENNETNSLEFESYSYKPITEIEIANILESLKERFPLATDFGLREPVEREVNLVISISGIKEVFVPVSDEEISTYTETDYPAWIKKCEKILRQLDGSLEKKKQPITFSFAVANEGTRPGKDALITFEAKGNFKIRPSQIKNGNDDDSKQNDADETLSLPLPPKPPEGKWKTSFGGRFINEPDFLDFFGKFMQHSIVPGFYENPTIESILQHSPLGPLNNRRDPNEFYYKSDRSIVPVESFSLECEQWRHGIGVEYFEGELCFDMHARKVHGALECWVHAENLSVPAKKLISVSGRVVPVSSHNCAEALIIDLLNRANK